MALAVVLLMAGGLGCDDRRNGSTAPRATGRADWFTDLAQQTGLDFVHVNGMSGERYFPEVMPPGVGLLDFDNDGDLDVYFVQGQILGSGKTVDQTLARPAGPLQGRLFRNDLRLNADGTRTLRFVDVTAQSGIRATAYGMGVAAGDIDNDGWVDLYLTNFGSNQMYRNNHDGTFTDISHTSGTDAAGFAVSASFVDYDRDGWLDLYVGEYVNYTIAADRQCTNLAGVRGYCPPQVYAAAPDRLYRNQGNGTFVDVTARALTSRQFGRALGVVAADFNNDGWSDIYVANDGGENLLWMNQRNGTFRNEALLAGVALTGEGHAEASMGVDAGDFDNDGDEDLFMTELNGEGSNLYVNNGAGAFDDRSAASGLGPASLQFTGFGTAWADFDNDGWLDLMSVNGRVQAAEENARAPFPMDQRKLLFRNLRDGRFEDVTSQAGSVFQLSAVGRGAAFGDIDNDGDADVVVSNDAGRAQLLTNNVGGRRHWVGVRLVGGAGRRDLLGARVQIVGNAAPSIWRRSHSDGSYASASDPRVLVGLGESDAPPTLRVLWPDGRSELWSDVPVDRWLTLVEGSGR